jgi:hypothetical protein
MTRRAGGCLAAAAGVSAGAAAFFLRMDAAYGPLRLSAHPSDWAIVWELFAHGQIAPRIVAESAALGAAAGAVPWAILALLGRRRGR